MGLPNLKSFFAGKAADLVNSVGGALDSLITNKEELAAAKLLFEKEVNRHMEAIESNAIHAIELDNADRDSARKREEAFVKATGRADWFQYFIGTIAIVSTPFLIYYILSHEIPPKNEHIALLLIGEVIGIVVGIYSYHYGSSAGSRFKDMKGK